ncbi:hypothetical protein OG345_04970 [Streptomyces sp. NBC_01220]|uniref:hypothetical protein n=1 Tax=Streptomyces sp. NBC_01220 TaxID=2903781 RepID=UPI00352FA39C|nr:hypothetical protein OG345_04970 [Streptomyces sp. NBC_01220]
MNSTPSSDVRAMRATASALDGQRSKLPVLADASRSPDVVGIAKQIAELGELITDLGNEVLFSTAGQDREAHTARVISGFAAAVQPTGEAASALGEVAHQLFFLDRTEHLRDQPDADDAREAAVRVINESIRTADTTLREAAGSLRAASATVSPPSVRLRAALSRSTTAAPSPAPPPFTAQTGPAPANQIARSR